MLTIIQMYTIMWTTWLWFRYLYEAFR